MILFIREYIGNLSSRFIIRSYMFEALSPSLKYNGHVKFILTTFVVIGIALLACGLTLDHLSKVRDEGNQPVFYQSYFEPAVLVACGHGFERLKGQRPSSLDDFLKLEINHFNCADLPAALDTAEATFVKQWYYMLQATAFTWKIFGLTWTAVDYLVAAIVMVSIIGVFAISLIYLPLPWAAAGALVVLLTQQYLYFSQFLRDVSKAPFIIVSILILLLIIKTKDWRLRFVVLPILFGLICGMGIGFRPDIAIMIPLSIFVISMMLPGFSLRLLTYKFLAAGFLITTFIITAAPPLSDGNTQGTCRYHWPLLGFGNVFSNILEIDQASVGLTYQFNDMLAYNIVKSHAQRNFGQDKITYCGPDYDQASGDLYWNVFAALPAEFVTRAYASVYQVMTSPPKVFVDPGKFTYLIASVLIIYALFLSRPWFAFGLTVSILYLLGYPAIQFSLRHYFHLSFIPVLFLLVAIHFLSKIILDKKRLHGLKSEFLKSVKSKVILYRSLVFIIVFVLVPVAMLTGLRSYQAQSLDDLVDRYQKYNWKAIALGDVSESKEEGVNIYPILNIENLNVNHLLLRISINTSKCDIEKSKVILKYNYQNIGYDFERSLNDLAGRGQPIDGVHYVQGFTATTSSRDSKRAYSGVKALALSPGMRPCLETIAFAQKGDHKGIWLDVYTRNGEVVRPHSTFR